MSTPFRARLRKILLHPSPVMFMLGKVINRLGLFSYPTRIIFNAEARPQYAYCIYSAAKLAKRLGYEKISVLEFGVAGGNGLVNAEYHAKKTEDATGVAVEVYGFDTGEGLPRPEDYRDLPYIWQDGFYRMDKEVLETRLSRAKLVLGNVNTTLDAFFSENDVAPIGCIFHDLDYYSSTRDSFRVFDLDERHRLPRIFNYFDDVLGNDLSLYNEFTGERLAIKKYNTAHDTSKIAPVHHFKRVAPFPWHSTIFIHHDFEHRDYNTYIGPNDSQSPLEN